MTESGLMFIIFDPVHEMEKFATVNTPGAMRSPETFHVLDPDTDQLFSAFPSILYVVVEDTDQLFFMSPYILNSPHQIIPPSFTTLP